MMGSHIDTVINAGKYDGCYGVLAGLEVIQSLQEQQIVTKCPLVVGAFTNEEGIRYSPDMKGQKNRDLLNLVRILNCISSKALF